MKKSFTILTIIITSILFFAFNVFNGSGKIGQTGAPGEGNCSSCHSGGAAGTTVSITASPSFSNDSYDPSTTYTVTLTVAHPSLTKFGFDCVVLNSSNANAGTISNGGSGVQFASSGGRNNATHTAAKSGTGSTSWTFQWVPPAFGEVKFYAAGNAVNGTGGVGGDTPGNTVLTLTTLATSINENNKEEISKVTLYPNPSSDLTTISYLLKSSQNINVQILEISGKLVKEVMNEKQEAGPHTQIVDLGGITKGIYFVKISAGNEKISQKLITIQ